MILQTAVTAATLLSEATTIITSGIGSTWDIITSNPMLTIFAGSSLLAIGFRFFKKAKRAAR